MALKSLYKEYWKTVSKEKGAWYADIKKAPPAQPWYNKLKQYNRKLIVTINRLRLGHCRTPSHLYKLQLVQNPTCPECQHNFAGLQHIFFQCPAYRIQRLILVCELDLVSEGVPVSQILQTLLYTEKYTNYFI
ncbi:unnamed protein product [Danaus chrysippus]|uniref:(African queen) hypothetical protein n=1 Tax=Danaus chrysippus TaxID=151541 RepID=A0A8J2QLX9_9NEOP|nr:unnamed protein product [Danaus chrysippus]